MFHNDCLGLIDPLHKDGRTSSNSRFVNSSDARSEANGSSRRSDRLSSAIYTASELFIPSQALDHRADSNKEHTDVGHRLRQWCAEHF